MFIIELSYIKSIEEIELLTEEHITWLNQYYQQNIFIASGRKVPRTGGIIFAQGLQRKELDKILASDPFQKVAQYSVLEVNISKTHPQLSLLIE